MVSIENLELPVNRLTDFLSLFDTEENLNEQFASFSFRSFELVLVIDELFKEDNLLLSNFKELGLKPN
jgi:hypothetical protein